MKKTDNKANARLKSTLVLIIVACVVIGLLSSTAIKLATATYLMQTSKKINTGFQPLDDYLNDKIDDMNQDPSPAPDTTKAPETTKAPDTTKAPETTKKAEETKKPDTTKAPETTRAPAKETTTSEAMVIKAHQSVLKSYNDVLATNKTASGRPGFTKTTERSLSKGVVASLWYSDIESQEGVAAYLAGETVKVNAGAATNELCINDLKKASIIDDTDFDTTKAAVKSSSKRIVYMGYVKNVTDGTVVHGYNKDKATGEIEYLFDYKADDYQLVKEVEAVKLVIEFNDEVNPKPIKNGKTDSFIASVFPVVTSEQVISAMDMPGIEKVDVTYTGCSVEMYYNIENAEIYSLTQNINYEIGVKDGLIGPKLLNGTVSDVNKYTNFVY